MFTCPVCDYDQLAEPPWQGNSGSHEICPQCHIQFGYDDACGGDASRRPAVYAAWGYRWKAEYGGTFEFDFGEAVDVLGEDGGIAWCGTVLGRSRDDDGNEWYALLPEGDDRTRMAAGSSLRKAS